MSYLHRLLGRTARQPSGGQDHPHFAPSLPAAWTAIAAHEPDSFIQPQEGTADRAATAGEEDDNVSPVPRPPRFKTSPPAPAPLRPVFPRETVQASRESRVKGFEKRRPGVTSSPPPSAAEGERRPSAPETGWEAPPDLSPPPPSRQDGAEIETASLPLERPEARLAPEKPPPAARRVAGRIDSPLTAAAEEPPPREEVAPHEPALPADKAPPALEERPERSRPLEPPAVAETTVEKRAVQLEPAPSFPETSPPSPPASAEPRVVIGRLHVEVVPQKATAPITARPVRVRRRSRRAQPANPSKLRFGLGQT